MGTFSLRSTEPGDAEGLNALYLKHTGIARTHDQFLWEWFAVPGGPAPSWVVVEEGTERIVAHHGVVPCPLWCGGETLNAARTENSMVDPEYRSRVMYVSYEAMLLKRLLKEYQLVFTTTGKGAPGAIRKRLGYAPVGRWYAFVLLETPAYLAARAAGNSAGAVASLLPAPTRPAPAGWSLVDTDDCERVAALWNKSREAYGLAPERRADHLAWRLGGNPYFPARMRIAVKDGRDLAFVALRDRTATGAAREISVEDVFCHDNDASCYHAVLRLVRRAHRRVSARLTLRAVKADTPLCEAAAAYAPARLQGKQTGGGAQFLVRTAEPMDLPRPDLTMLTTEGID